MRNGALPPFPEANMGQIFPPIQSPHIGHRLAGSVRGIDLHRELLHAMQRARDPHKPRRVRPMLDALGVSPKLISCWGVAIIETFGPGCAFYQPAEDGRWALIVGVVEAGDLIDLCAIDLETQHVGTRLGIGKALGLDDIDKSRWEGCDLQLVDQPLAWLREPVGSAFIIDWSVVAFTLADLDPIDCGSVALAERVERAFLRPRPVPRLLVAA
jgi:hypothetical protein